MTGTTVEVRVARSQDVDALLAMMAPFNRSEGISWRPRRVEAALRRLLAEPALGVVLVAEERALRTGRTPLGYVVATFNYDLEFAGADAFVTELFVLPAARGRGLGRRLLDAAATNVRRAGAGALHLLVLPSNRVARALYRKAGFEEVPRRVMTRVLPRRTPRAS